MCTHKNTRYVTEAMPFRGSVATPGITDENQAAHGWASFVEQCLGCKSRRTVNVNGKHLETSAWSPEDAS